MVLSKKGPSPLTSIPKRTQTPSARNQATLDIPLKDPPLKAGEVFHIQENPLEFQKVILTLHCNGISVRIPGETEPHLSLAWSPFSLVQACRFHTALADLSQPSFRLFKVSVFHHGASHYFAVFDADADDRRMRWVADLSRSLRSLTQSLIKISRLTVQPLAGAHWTSTRLLAGYLLLYDDQGVTRVYAELHVHGGGSAAFAAYEDATCMVQVAHFTITLDTPVSERVGIDCGCFSLGDYHFAARSCGEKILWLRAVGNVRMKLRHTTCKPTPMELRHYRSAVKDFIKILPDDNMRETGEPLLPRRAGCMSSDWGHPGDPLKRDPLKPLPIYAHGHKNAEEAKASSPVIALPAEKTAGKVLLALKEPPMLFSQKSHAILPPTFPKDVDDSRPPPFPGG
eukprot:TRINITY_DN15006_c0_g2_i1.p1 TRINITY_DN15006_c0_g2~~TRINITY_DN15006_c0_g2_i1.p1  ORF type:complete len:398 (-),score=58.68 TRINITY_DN15006_c0_g2_i1:45-1238(-)